MSIALHHQLTESEIVHFKMSPKSAFDESELKSFGAVKGVCKVLGICSYRKPYLNTLANFINIILIILQLALVLPSIAYFIRYLSDVNDAAEVLSILFPSVLHLGQYSILVFTKLHLVVLLEHFEELLDRSACK